MPVVKRYGIDIELKRKDPKAGTNLIFVDIVLGSRLDSDTDILG